MIVGKLQIYHARVNNYFILKCFVYNLKENTVKEEGRLAGKETKTKHPAGWFCQGFSKTKNDLFLRLI